METPKTSVAPTSNTVEGWYCRSCHTIYDEEPIAYECGNCGTIQTQDDGNRCQDCNLFMARKDESVCPDCDEELQEFSESVECPHCNEVVPLGIDL